MIWGCFAATGPGQVQGVKVCYKTMLAWLSTSKSSVKADCRRTMTVNISVNKKTEQLETKMILLLECKYLGIHHKLVRNEGASWMKCETSFKSLLLNQFQLLQTQCLFHRL